MLQNCISKIGSKWLSGTVNSDLLNSGSHNRINSIFHDLIELPYFNGMDSITLYCIPLSDILHTVHYNAINGTHDMKRICIRLVASCVADYPAVLLLIQVDF